MRLRNICISLLCLTLIAILGLPLHCDELKDEIKLGRSIAAILAGTYGIYQDKEVSLYVNLVGNTVAYYAGRGDLDYYFAVLDSDGINAFACPGGYIFITRGLLFTLHNEAELAGVLAHEIAHVNYKHVYKAVVQKKTDSAESVLAKMIGGRNVSFSIAFNQLVSKGLEILLKKGLAQTDEFEADAAAVVYTGNADYASSAYFNVLEYLNSKTISPKEKYSLTHPPMSVRIDRLKEFSSQIDTGKLLAERFTEYVKK